PDLFGLSVYLIARSPRSPRSHGRGQCDRRAILVCRDLLDYLNGGVSRKSQHLKQRILRWPERMPGKTAEWILRSSLQVPSTADFVHGYFCLAAVVRPKE